MSVRSTAALRKPRSKKALWPTSTARLQPADFTALRTCLKISVRAWLSLTAIRSGWSSLMPVNSSAAGSTLAPSKGSIRKKCVWSGYTCPSSSIRIGVAAISSRASVRELKPPVSTSTTTGRKPRKRSQMEKGFIDDTLSEQDASNRFPGETGSGIARCDSLRPGGILELLVQNQVQRQAHPEAGNVGGDRAQAALVFRGAQVHVNPRCLAVDELVQEGCGEDVVASCVRCALPDVRDIAVQLTQELLSLWKGPDALAAVATGFLQHRVPVGTVGKDATVAAGNDIEAGTGQRRIVDDEPRLFPARQDERIGER